MAPLNHKQRAFAVAYTTGDTLGNATQSAIAAGYSARTAHDAGSRLLTHTEVKKLIAERTEKHVAKLERKADDILEELARLGFSDIGEFYQDHTCAECGCEKGGLKHPRNMSPKARSAIASFEEEDLFEGNHEDTAAGEDGGRFVIGRIRKLKLWSKERGLELLGKNLALFTDKVEVSGKLTLEQLVQASIKPKAGE